MPTCPNCGQRTEGDFCQWCGYPLTRGGPVRGEGHPKELTEQKERTKKVNKEAEEAKERAKREAEEAKERAKREAEQAKEAKQAEERAKKEAEKAAKERAKREAEEAKEKAEEEAKMEAEEAKEKAKREAEMARVAKEAKEAISAELYEGIVKLTIMSPIDLAQMRKLEEYLRHVQDLRLVLTGGSADEGTHIMVSAAKPLHLINVLKEMPPVEEVVKKDKEIQITLKAQ